MTVQLDYAFLWQTFFTVLSGLPVTLLIVLVALACAMPLGFLVALGRNSRVKGLARLLAVYVSFIRGTPLLVQIYLLYFSLPPLLNQLFAMIDLPFTVSNDRPLLYACFIFAFSTTAYLSETFRSALAAVDQGQFEAAHAIGLSDFQAYTRIVIPQALPIALPSIGNVAIGVVKGTSLVFVIQVEEITAKGKLAAAENLHYIEAYIDVFVVYLILCLIIDSLFAKAEKKLNKSKRLSQR